MKPMPSQSRIPQALPTLEGGVSAQDRFGPSEATRLVPTTRCTVFTRDVVGKRSFV